MSYKENYKGCIIQSFPYRLAKTETHNFSVNGIIRVDHGNSVNEIMTQELGVPDEEWAHDTEKEADLTFSKYAKKVY